MYSLETLFFKTDLYAVTGTAGGHLSDGFLGVISDEVDYDGVGLLDGEGEGQEHEGVKGL